MKRAVIVLSVTLLALEAAAIPLRHIDAAPVMLPEPEAAIRAERGERDRGV